MIAIGLNILRSGGMSRLGGAGWLVLAAVLFCGGLRAQSPAAADSLPQFQQLPPGFMDSTLTDSISGVSHRKSPSGALLRALALPGWGQFYTGHPVRGGLAAALETGFFVMMARKFSDRNSQRDRLHALERANGPDWPVDDPERVALNEHVKSLNRKAGDYMAYGITTLVLSLVDSYVSAHLYQFDRNFYACQGSTRLALHLEF
ncbi:DUF5683 domain-containing protein [bacterium]|nr:DUF5683 domain-containing protein [bacterium]